MPFVPVKCTNCGGEIQLDDQLKSGFCVYCGSKVVFKEAVQKMEFSGSVSVQGIATLEKLLQNAETFQKLGYYEKELEILTQITQNYPEDYRGWWGLALTHISMPYVQNENKYGELNEYKWNQSESSMINSPMVNGRTEENIFNAIKLAPSEKILEMKTKSIEYYASWFLFLYWEKDKLNKYFEYTKIALQIDTKAKINAEEELKKRAEEEAKKRAEEIMGKKADRDKFAIVFIVAGLIICGSFLYGMIKNSSRAGGWPWLLGVAILIIILLFFKIRGTLPPLRSGKWPTKPYYDSYYSEFLDQEMQKLSSNRPQLQQEWWDRECANAPIKRGMYSSFQIPRNENSILNNLSSCEGRINELTGIINKLENSTK